MSEFFTTRKFCDSGHSQNFVRFNGIYFRESATLIYFMGINFREIGFSQTKNADKSLSLSFVKQKMIKELIFTNQPILLATSYLLCFEHKTPSLRGEALIRRAKEI